jgi:hypothetical protein
MKYAAWQAVNGVEVQLLEQAARLACFLCIVQDQPLALHGVMPTARSPAVIMALRAAATVSRHIWFSA